MKALVKGVSLPEALQELASPVYSSTNADESDCYGEAIKLRLDGLRVGRYVAIWMVCDNPEVETGSSLECFVSIGALDAAVHRIWHEYDGESLGLPPPSSPTGRHGRLPDYLEEVTALLGRYDRPNGRKPAHPVPMEVFSRICTSARDFQERWWGWDGASLYLCPVGKIGAGPKYGNPRYDENLIELLSAVGVRIERLAPHPEARGDDFLALLLNSVALHERGRARQEIDRRWRFIQQRQEEIARLSREIERYEERLREDA